MPAFSVIIPAHNEEAYLQKTIDSIRSQTLQDYEIILVTNGCTDRTEEVARKNLDERTRHLSLAKANVSVARNAGALNAQGETLVFLDADTQLAEDALGTILEKFKEKHSIATTLARPDSQKIAYQLAVSFKNWYHYLNLYQGCSGALVCRKTDFHAVGGYDPEIVVREHRKLALKLKELGGFTCINTKVTTSMRRYQQWGLLKVTVFWLRKWIQDKSGKLKDSSYETIR